MCPLDNDRRSPSVPASEAALKGLEESASQSEKAVEDRSNPLGMGRSFRSFGRGLSVLRNIFRVGGLHLRLSC
jgi:hypothetical protein